MKALRKCRECGLEANTENDLNLFVTNRLSKYNKANLCKDCAETQQKEYRKSEEYQQREKQYRQKDSYKNRRKNKDYQNKYGITLKDYDSMLHSQNGCCKICGIHHTKVHFGLVVDHNHKNGEVRGLLCGKCNTGIGNLQDSIEILQKAITYLEENGSYAESQYFH